MEQCLVLNVDGDTLDEIALVEVNRDEFLANGKVTVFSYDLNDQEWENAWEATYDVDARLALQKGDLDGDHREELLVANYMGASGSALDYQLYQRQDSQLAALPFAKAYEQQEKYLQGDEWASYFDVKIEGDYLVESFSTYGPDDPHCCPSGDHVSVYFRLDEDGNVAEKSVMREAINGGY